MSPDEREHQLATKQHRLLKSPRLKPTPDLLPDRRTYTQDEIDELRLIYEFEEELHQQNQQRGY